jgi:hypothetical protein
LDGGSELLEALEHDAFDDLLSSAREVPIQDRLAEADLRRESPYRDGLPALALRDRACCVNETSFA